MGSRLGVQRSGRSSSGGSQSQHKQPSAIIGRSTEPQAQQQLRPQFAFDSDAHVPHPQHLRAGISAPTRPTTSMASTAPTANGSQRSNGTNPTMLASAPSAPPPAAIRRDLVRRLSSARSVRSFDSLDSPSNSSFRRFAAASGGSTSSASAPAERAHRKREAEKILEEIAKEYAAKRAAGLVPSIPVPARTLLWEELARTERSRVGRRGQCVYGRDTDRICGCMSYKKKKLRGQANPGGVCECCNHGGAWHRLAGGAMTQRTSQGYTRSYAGSSVRASRVGSVRCSDAPSRASEYADDDEYDDDEYYDEYDDDEYDEDDDDDDDDIASEVARPYDSQQPQPHQQMPMMMYHTNGHSGPPNHATQGRLAPPPPTMSDSEVDMRESLERDSMFSSSGSSLSLPSGARQLDALLRAIQRYRQAGYSEDEIDALIAADFPPAPRRNSQRVSFVSGELATM